MALKLGSFQSPEKLRTHQFRFPTGPLQGVAGVTRGGKGAKMVEKFSNRHSWMTLLSETFEFCLQLKRHMFSFLFTKEF